MKVKAEYVGAPWGHSTFDWIAVDDDTYDGPGCPIGYGRTEQEAIENLQEKLEAPR